MIQTSRQVATSLITTCCTTLQHDLAVLEGNYVEMDKKKGEIETRAG
jgi:hypothetical protein